MDKKDKAQQDEVQQEKDWAAQQARQDKTAADKAKLEKDKAQLDKEQQDREGLDKLLQLLGTNFSVPESVKQLLANIVTQLKNIEGFDGDPKKAITWLIGILTEYATEIANAVAANTVAAPEVIVAPEVIEEAKAKKKAEDEQATAKPAKSDKADSPKPTEAQLR